MKLSSHKIKYLKNIIALISLAFIAIVFLFSNKFSEMRLEAKRSEITLILEAYASAQSAYFEEYKEFSSDKSTLGVTPISDKVIAYFDKDEIPENIRVQIKLESVPYVSKDSFRILCIYYINKDKPEVWTINNSRVVSHSGNITVN